MMWSVKKPEVEALETFNVCISRVKNSDLRARLRSIRDDISAAAADYMEKAEQSELHLIAQVDPVGTVLGSELVATYDGRMAKKGQPGRYIYDQIKLLPEGDRCPYCDHRNVSTVDHILPKALYPIFAVTPVNLVGSCSDCNKAKLDLAPTSALDTVLHPYFDVVSDQPWLCAEVVESTPVALTFSVAEIDDWSAELNARLSRQFDLLRLATLYSRQAARETNDIRLNLQRHFDFGGADAVRTELRYQWESRYANRINSWQTATYAALKDSEWYCAGGFAEV